MNMQASSRLARLGTRLAEFGNRHRDLETRIARLKTRAEANPVAVKLITREKQRVQREMNYCEDMLRTYASRLVS